MKAKVSVLLLPDDGAWVAYAPVLGVASEGDTKDDALRMVKDAIQGCLQADDGEMGDLLEVAYSGEAALAEVEVDVPKRLGVHVKPG